VTVTKRAGKLTSVYGDRYRLYIDEQAFARENRQLARVIASRRS
jgi:hypothetical protein